MSDTLHRQIALLRGQLDERDETIRQLRSQLIEKAPLPSWLPRLTRQEEQLFRLLWKRDGVVPHGTIQSILPDYVDDARNQVSVCMVRLRRKLAGTGISITNVHSRGYQLTGTGVERLRSAA